MLDYVCTILLLFQFLCRYVVVVVFVLLAMLSTNVSHFTSGRPKSRDLKIVSSPLRDELSADFHATTRSGDQMR